MDRQLILVVLIMLSLGCYSKSGQLKDATQISVGANGLAVLEYEPMEGHITLKVYSNNGFKRLDRTLPPDPYRIDKFIGDSVYLSRLMPSKSTEPKNGNYELLYDNSCKVFQRKVRWHGSNSGDTKMYFDSIFRNGNVVTLKSKDSIKQIPLNEIMLKDGLLYYSHLEPDNFLWFEKVILSSGDSRELFLKAFY